MCTVCSMAVLHAVHQLCARVLVDPLHSVLWQAPLATIFLFNQRQPCRSQKGRYTMGYTRAKGKTRAARVKHRQGVVQYGNAAWLDFLIEIKRDDYHIRRTRNGKLVKGRCV